ncbi:MAG: AsmA family protein [Devosiaceae bacterium]|nr:AsmA family protein [Devosiaceae bacterium MH13]
MNRFFLVVGIFLLCTLTAALVAPRYIDWSNYTAVIEQQASRLLGREVHVSGAVDLRILPMPRLTFTDVEFASRSDGSVPEVRVQRMEALMSLAPFLRGQAEIVELTLDQPVITLSALEPGSDAQDDGVDLGSISVEEAIIQDGRIERLKADGSIQVLADNLNARLSAPSVLGPWRVDPASAVIGGERVDLRINTGAYDGDRRMRVRVSVAPVNRPLEVSVDGFLDWSGDEARFEGQSIARSHFVAADQAAATGDAADPITWRVEGELNASLAELVAQNVQLTLGQAEDQAFVLTGHARSTLGESPRFSAALSSRQVDLDRALGGGAAEPVSLQTGWAAASELLTSLDRITVPGDIAFDIPAIVINGAVIRDIGFDATYRPGQPLALDSLEALFPGDTQFGFSGAVASAPGRGLTLDGGMRLQSAAPGLFIAWSTGRADADGTLSQLASVNLAGRVQVEPGVARLDRLQGDIDGQGLTGSIGYRGQGGEGSGQLDLTLDAGRFDFGLLAGLADWLTADRATSDGGGFDVRTVNADLTIDALVTGPEDLGQVAVRVASTPERVRIDELRIGDAVGARLSASGFIDRGSMPPMGELAINAELERLGGVVRLLRDVTGDSPFLADLQRNAGLYEPASVSGSYSNSTDAGFQLSLQGSLAGSDYDVTGTIPATGEATELTSALAGARDGSAGNRLSALLGTLFDRPSEIRATVRADDAFALVGQLGFAALPNDLQGPGSLQAVLTGPGDGPPQVRLAFDGLQSTLRLEGLLEGAGDIGVTGLSGSGSVFADDVAQLGLMAGMAMPGLFDPFAASAGFDLSYSAEGQTASLTNLSGTVADVPVSGAAQLSLGPLGSEITADIDAEQADLQGLLATFLGPTGFDLGFSEGWPEGPFAFNPLPATLDLNLTTPRLSVWDDVTVLNASLELTADGQTVSVEDLSGSLLDGQLDARLVLRDAERGGLLEGRLALSDADLGTSSWERGGSAVLRGRGDVSLSLESAGGSISSLMSAVTGEGTLALRDAQVSGLGLGGFARVLQASDAGLLGEDADLEAAFADALSAGSMAIDRADSPLTLVAGVLRASNLFVQGEETALRGGFTLDFSDLALDADFSYAATSGPGDVPSMPNVGLSFAGPVASPERTLDVAQVASFLNVRALENEIRRVEALNAEILERESLLRIMGSVALDEAREERLVALAAERQAAREAEEAEAAAEAERLRLEEARQAAEAEEAARRAAEETAAPPPAPVEQLDLSLPPLGDPIIVEPAPAPLPNPLSLGENVPATDAPLDLTPLNLAPN